MNEKMPSSQGTPEKIKKTEGIVEEGKNDIATEENEEGKMFKKDFSVAEAGYVEKNIVWFQMLESGDYSLKYERRTDKDMGVYYDMLYVGDNEIPVPVFLDIIGRGEVDNYTAVTDLLQEKGFSAKVDHGSCLPDEIVGDAEAIKKYLLENPESFCEEHLLPSMRDDKEFILQLISKGVKALNSHIDFVSNRLKGDKDVALAAIKLNTNNYVGLSSELQKDSDVIEALFEHEQGPGWLISGPKEVLDNFDIMSRAVKCNPDMLNVIGHSCGYLKKNTRLMVEAIRACDKPQIILHYYKDLSAEQRRDPEIQKVVEEKRDKFGSIDVSVSNPDKKSNIMSVRINLGRALDECVATPKP